MVDIKTLPKGTDDLKIVNEGWDDNFGEDRYSLIVWNPNGNNFGAIGNTGGWSIRAMGKKDWAQRVAKHYGIDVQET